MRRAAVIVVTSVALLLSAAAPVAAAKPSRACPNASFEAMGMEAFRQVSLGVGVPADQLFTPEWEAGWDAFDKNGDGTLCVKDLPDTSGTFFGWIFNVIDNTSSH